MTKTTPSPYDLPLDEGTNLRLAQEAIRLAIRLHREMGLKSLVALEAAVSHTGAGREVVEEMLFQIAFQTIGEV